MLPSLEGYLSGSVDETQQNRPPPCQFKHDDLTKRILDGIRLITFKYVLSVAQSRTAGPDVAMVASEKLSKFPDKYRYSRNIYKSNYYTLGGAAAIMSLAVSCTASLFYGYDKLGRQVSLSSLETSLALRIVNEREIRATEGKASNATGAELMQLYGDIKVRYGEVKPNELGMGPVEDVSQPRDGEQYK